MPLQDSSGEAIIGGEERTSQFRLKLEEFSFKSPQVSPPLRRSTRSCVRENFGGPPGSAEISCKLETSTSGVKERATVSASEISTPKSTKRKREYAPPETYAHLDCLTDCLGNNLDVLFCGINPGVHSATVGHHFAHPGNRFYRMLYGSGFTDRLIPPEQDATLPALYNIGITDIVDRPSSCEGELSAEEMINGIPALLQKVAKYKPRFVCFIGKGMGQRVEKGFRLEIAKSNTHKAGFTQEPTTPARSGEEKRSFKHSGKKTNSRADSGIGLRPFKVTHTSSDSLVHETVFFVSHSSSGLATSMNLQKKVELLTVLRELVAKHKDGTLDTSTLEEVPILHPPNQNN